MAITLDGDSVSEITIDGEVVSEVTVDGDVVYTADDGGGEPDPDPEPSVPMMIDSFERPTLDYYSNTTATQPTLSTTRATDGSQSLGFLGDETNSYAISAPGDGLPFYPQPGYTYEWDVYMPSATGAVNVYFGGTGYDSCYGIEMGEYGYWFHHRDAGTSTEIEYVDVPTYDGQQIGDWVHHELTWTYDDAAGECQFDFVVSTATTDDWLVHTVTDPNAVHTTEGIIGFRGGAGFAAESNVDAFEVTAEV